MAIDQTTDDFLGGRVKLAQPARGYRGGMDAVMLAAAVEPTQGRAIEFGCGAGAALLCLAARAPALALVGIERQPEMAALARANAAANDVAERVEVIGADFVALGDVGVFDAALMNPPFFDPAAGLVSPNPQKRQSAHAETPLDHWINAAANRLTGGAILTLIHQAAALPEILAALDGRLGGVEVAPLWPRAGQAAKRVLVRARKGSRAPFALRPGLILHDAAGFTAPAQAILMDGARFAW
jgi:tRNA1(Val) A37 N6-methylase TrmN6